MQWYDEIKDHNFSLDYQPGTGHFTQVKLNYKVNQKKIEFNGIIF